MVNIASFLIALLLSLILTRLVRDAAFARGWIAGRSSHHIHRNPVPRLGGVAIFISFAILALLLTLISDGLNLKPRVMLWITIPAVVVFLVGLYDDLYSVKPFVKFSAQALAATLLYLGGVGRFNLPLLLGLPDLEWLALPMTIFWVLLITNAFNLIDGLDGLAAGSTLFSTLTLFVFSFINGNHAVSTLALVLAGAIAGFLRFNFNPATIFLGDSGSLFLGFMLSALALAGSQKKPTMVAVAIPVVAFGLPIIETSISVIRRFLSGRPLFSADREHIHHKLLERGWTQRQAVIALYCVSAICGLLSLAMLQPGGIVAAAALVAFSTGIWFGVRRLGYYEFQELGRAAHRTIEQKRIISRNVAILRASDRLAEAKCALEIFCILQDAVEANGFSGFQLSLTSQVHEQPLADEIEMLTQDRKAERHYAWHRPPQDEPTPSSQGWALTLELDTNRGYTRGFLTLYHSDPCASSLIDVSLLTSQLTDALATAVERVICLNHIETKQCESAFAAAQLEGNRMSRLELRSAC
ncbi:MAG TPA: MraY family glycosyltransferase [Blastocatellia bacterium]|nr:MraY family glycosyltransferase [Blastocatellia bacterium]